MLIPIVIIFILWLLFWSLSTVLIDRWHKWKWGILFWRSECPKCRHQLSSKELIPLFSYIFQRGKCSHCHSKISLFYPISEFIMGLIFVVITLSHASGWWLFLSPSHILMLVLGFITWVYILYDFRYMEIPDQILIPWIYWYILLITLWWFYRDIESLFFDRFTYSGSYADFALDHIISAIGLYTFFYLQIVIPGWIYLLKKGKIREFIELIYSYFLFPFLLLFPKRNKDSSDEAIPTWVWGGDLRVALFIGLTLWTIHGISSFFFAYILGSIFGIYTLIRNKKSDWDQNIVPFGPFLWIWWIISIVYHEQILLIFSKFSIGIY
jgi:prepilin signal peptidase PulO-like enzyme (type II secretory pathway)